MLNGRWISSVGRVTAWAALSLGALLTLACGGDDGDEGDGCDDTAACVDGTDPADGDDASGAAPPPTVPPPAGPTGSGVRDGSPGEGGNGTDGDGSGSARPIPPQAGGAAVAHFALVSESAEPVVNRNSCQDGVWVDHECDGRYEQQLRDCDPADGVAIAFVADDPCPVCEPVADGTPELACEDARADYRTFMAHNVTQSCASFCEEDADCFAWQIDNACGRVAIPLYGAIDEEPMLFADLYAAHHCGACGDVPQTVVGTNTVGATIAGDLQDAPLLQRYAALCDPAAHVCVLEQMPGDYRDGDADAGM